jgi:hypothetical protein
MSEPMSAKDLAHDLDDMAGGTTDNFLSINKAEAHIEIYFAAIRAQERQACVDRWCAYCIFKNDPYYAGECVDCVELKRIKGEMP